MNSDESPQDYKVRSNFVRGLVQCAPEKSIVPEDYSSGIPKKIVQFWDRFDRLPEDVLECIRSWQGVEVLGFERLLFDECKAKTFIKEKLGQRYIEAFDKCYHPAMLSDYFRLCYIAVEGGCYVDADDEWSDVEIDFLFRDGRVKLQPLCYDIATDSMVPVEIFSEPGASDENWIFYFNNNPLIAQAGHPVILRALENATISLEISSSLEPPEIQSTTGPGNLTGSIVSALSDHPELEKSMLIAHHWEKIAKSKWELEYRNDSRNWRLSNGRYYDNQ